MSETDLSKRESFQFGLLEFRSESKSIRGEFVAWSSESKFVPKNPLTPRGFLLGCLITIYSKVRQGRVLEARLIRVSSI